MRTPKWTKGRLQPNKAIMLGHFEKIVGDTNVPAMPWASFAGKTSRTGALESACESTGTSGRQTECPEGCMPQARDRVVAKVLAKPRVGCAGQIGR